MKNFPYQYRALTWFSIALCFALAGSTIQAMESNNNRKRKVDMIDDHSFYPPQIRRIDINAMKIEKMKDEAKEKKTTPLLLAINRLRPENIEFLLDHKEMLDHEPHNDLLEAVCNPPTGTGSSMLTQNRMESRAIILRTLLKHGISPNTVIDDQGNTPLHIVCQNLNHSSENHQILSEVLLNILLAYKANPNIPNNSGCLPIELAASLYKRKDANRHMNNAAIRTLIQYGASTNINIRVSPCSTQYCSIIDAAKERAHTTTAHILENAEKAHVIEMFPTLLLCLKEKYPDFIMKGQNILDALYTNIKETIPEQFLHKLT